MKNSYLNLLFLLFTLSMFAQEENMEKQKLKEIGLTMRSFDNFGATYRFGTSKALWRINTAILANSNRELSYEDQFTNSKYTNLSFQFGREFRKPISKVFQLRYGMDISFSYLQNKNEDSREGSFMTKIDQKIYQPGVNLVLGCNYQINKSLAVGLEILPSFSYQTGKETREYSDRENEEWDIKQTQFGFRDDFAQLSFVYQF